MPDLTYSDFLAAKSQLRNAGGFEPIEIPEHLFGFQRELVDWAVRQGRGALFADCGLGKTPMELAWASNVQARTGRPVLLLTPLAVGFQIVHEAEKFHCEAAMSRDGTVAGPVTVTNYEQLEKFDPDDFAGVVCDESSAIKAFDGRRRAIVTEFMRRVPFRLLGTATAAPNDYLELGTSSEALGLLGYLDMFNRFFVNDQRTSDTRSKVNRQGKLLRAAAGGGVRFKGHAAEPFWRWVSSWARAIRKPSDYGYSDDGFQLPPLEQHTHVVAARTARPDTLFDTPAVGLAEEREEARRTITERCERAAAALADAAPGVAWCNLNDESALLAKLIDGAVEVSGSDSPEAKEEKLRAFTDGEIRVLVTKPKIGAWGLNWQHCHRVTYFPTHSYEQYYQAVRRCWRFGQTQPVRVDLITTESGARAVANLERKAAQADVMFDRLLAHMADALHVQPHNPYTNRMEVPVWLAS
jgi:hypothetical protein